MPCPRRSLTPAGLAASILRVLAVVGLLAMAPGCNNECRSLCTTWYDYLRDVCRELDTDDDRVRCISDYRAARVSLEERDQCAEEQVEVQRVALAGDGCLCDGDKGDCGDDDDSSAR